MLSPSGEEQAAILQTLHGIARERGEMCSWEQNFSPVLSRVNNREFTLGIIKAGRITTV